MKRTLGGLALGLLLIGCGYPNSRYDLRVRDDIPAGGDRFSLALQCLYDKGELEPHRQEILDLAAEHPGSWISYLGRDTLEHGKTNSGVDPKYRPRGYNEGPSE